MYDSVILDNIELKDEIEKLSDKNFNLTNDFNNLLKDYKNINTLKNKILQDNEDLKKQNNELQK